MNTLLLEAAAIGFKEALKLAAVWLMCSSFFAAYGRQSLMRSFYAGVGLASLLFVISFFMPHDVASRQWIAKLTGYVFFLCFMASLVLFFSPREPGPSRKAWEPAAVVFAAAVYFSPDIVGSSLYVREVAELSVSGMGIYLSAGGGFILPAALFVVLGSRPVVRAERYFGLAQVFVFLALVKFLGGGTSGFAEISLVGSVQQGLAKFVHDVIHQSFVFLMLPDHPLLLLTAWNFIGFFFGPLFTWIASLVILAGPMLAYLYIEHSAEIPVPEALDSGAERRMYRAGVRSEKRRRSAVVAVFVVLVFFSWYSSGGGEGAKASLEVPRPSPVVPEGGVLVIPVKTPGEDLMDGNLHMFSVRVAEEDVRIMAIRKPDGKLSVCLDACEICPPEGYGRSGGNVVCIYCMTPIPIETLGRPGGCNPIPLEFTVTDTEVRIDFSEVEDKWRYVLSGESREGIR
jgi:hypothetical protein